MKTEVWNNHEIRFVSKEGEWWAVAKDVATALGYAKANNLIKRMRQRYKGTAKWSTLGGVQELVVLSEQGIYKAIMNSHKPEAEAFEDWVFEIIKQLRQSSGFEGFEIFRMLDKEHQKEMMHQLKQGLKEPVRRDFIKANTIANKAVSTKYGHSKMVKKADMTPQMLEDRQELLDSAVELMTFKDKFGLNLSVSEEVYRLANKEGNKQLA